MKFLLIAAFVALCTASTVYRGKNISVGDDGTIRISTSGGKRVVITRPVGYGGQKTIDIDISGPNMPTKKIQINDDTNNLYDVETGNNSPWSSANSVGEEFRLKRSSKKSQGDVLVDICKDYQGYVDEPLFQKFLTKIEKAVQKGEINRQIYEILLCLDQICEGGILGYDQGLNTLGQNVLLNGQDLYIPQGLQNWQTTRFVNPLLSYQQGGLLNGGLLQDGTVIYGNTQMGGNALLRQYLINQQQNPVTGLWKSMAYQPLLNEGLRGQVVYGLGQQPIMVQGLGQQQGSIAQFLNILRRQQQGQGIVDSLVQQPISLDTLTQQGQTIVQTLGDLVQQQQQQKMPIIQTLGGLTQQRQPIVQTYGGLVQQQLQQQQPIVQTLGGLMQQRQPIVQTLGLMQQRQPIVQTYGDLVQQQQREPIFVQTLGGLNQQEPIIVQQPLRGLVQQQEQPIVLQTLGGMVQQRQPIVIQGQQRVPQVVY